VIVFFAYKVSVEDCFQNRGFLVERCIKKGRVIAGTAFPFKQNDLQFDADYLLHNFFIYFPFVVYFFQLQYLFA